MTLPADVLTWTGGRGRVICGLPDPIPYEEPQVIMAAEKETLSSPEISLTGYLIPRGRP